MYIIWILRDVCLLSFLCIFCNADYYLLGVYGMYLCILRMMFSFILLSDKQSQSRYAVEHIAVFEVTQKT